MSGGTKMKSITGKTVYTSNLTPDKATGIGNFTKEEFVKAVKTGISKGDKMLHYPMPVFHELTDEQASSIYAYLQTLKPVNKKIRRSD